MFRIVLAEVLYSHKETFMSNSILWYQPGECVFHTPYPFTAEKPARYNALLTLPDVLGYEVLQGGIISQDQLLRAHAPAYLAALERTISMGRLHGMYYAARSPFLQYYTAPYGLSYIAAQSAAGSVCSAVNAVLENRNERAFCAIRPPGHHAGYAYGEGFCILNNVAIGALEAHARGARVTIIDFDRHHGNGTEEIIARANSDALFFASSYQAGCKYAAKAAPLDTRSITIRVPLEHGSDYHEVARGYQKEILDRIIKFKPDVILLSAGFDLHTDDALRPKVKLSTAGFGYLTERIVEVADSVGAGIVSVLEGGYTIPSLHACVEVHVRVLTK